MRDGRFLKYTGTSSGTDVEMTVKPDLTAPRKTREIPMRAMACVALAAAALAATPACAQTYDPAYPVCMQVYGLQNYISCRYASMEQCRMLASGRAAQCIVNPYFARGKKGRYRDPY
jgi:hypothetical protein